MPLSVVGVVLGGWVLSGIDVEQFTTLLGVLIVWSLGLLSVESTMISLQGIPSLVIGAAIGYYFLKRLKLTQFKWLIRVMATIAAVKLFVIG